MDRRRRSAPCFAPADTLNSHHHAVSSRADRPAPSQPATDYPRPRLGRHTHTPRDIVHPQTALPSVPTHRASQCTHTPRFTVPPHTALHSGPTHRAKKRECAQPVTLSCCQSRCRDSGRRRRGWGACRAGAPLAGQAPPAPRSGLRAGLRGGGGGGGGQRSACTVQGWVRRKEKRGRRGWVARVVGFVEGLSSARTGQPRLR